MLIKIFYLIRTTSNEQFLMIEIQNFFHDRLKLYFKSHRVQLIINLWDIDDSFVINDELPRSESIKDITIFPNIFHEI